MVLVNITMEMIVMMKLMMMTKEENIMIMACNEKNSADAQLTTFVHQVSLVGKSF